MGEPLRVVFMGSAELACASLEALVACDGMNVVAVVTQPDKPAGRKLQPQPSPVKRLATKLGLPVLQPVSLRDPQAFAQLQALAPQLVVVAAYGQILPAAVLNLPLHGCLNIHTSLLPKYRGAAPIQSALLNGDAETGVTLMKMDAGLDTGDIVATVATPLAPDETAQTLHDRLAQLGAQLLLASLPDFLSGKIRPQPQPATGASYAAKIKKEDGRIDWSQSAHVLDRRIRAFTPWPGAFTDLPVPTQRLLKVRTAAVVDAFGEPGRVLDAEGAGPLVACSEQALRLLWVQREGGQWMSGAEFLRGCPLQVGQQLGA